MTVSNKKGKVHNKRPIHTRILAVIMAAFMVLSIIYINNRSGIVEAASSIDLSEQSINDESYLATREIKKDTTVYVPAKGIMFKLPEYSDELNTSEISIYKAVNISDSNDVIYYYNGDETYDPTEDPTYADYTVNQETLSISANKKYGWYSGDTPVTSVTSAADNVAVVRKSWYESGYTATVAGTDIDLSTIVNLPASYIPYTTAVEDFTLTVSTFEISNPTFSIDNENKTITASDANKDSASNSETELYYCDINYELVRNNLSSTAESGNVTSVEISGVQDLLSSSYGTAKDDVYWIKKNVTLPSSSGYDSNLLENDIVVPDSTGAKRDFHIISDYYVEYNNNAKTNVVSMANTFNSSSLICTLPSVNPSKDVTVYFTTDSDISSENCVTRTSENGANDISVASTGTANSYKVIIPGNVSVNKGINAVYQIAPSHDNAKDTITISITYGDGTPNVSIGNTEVYSTSNSFTVNGTFSKSENDATISAEDVKFKQGTTDVIADAETKNATVSESTATLNATLQPGDNYFWLWAKSSYGSEATSSPAYHVFYDDEAPVITTLTANNTDAAYSGYGGTGAIDNNNITVSNYLTTQDEVVIGLEVEDKQNGGTSDGSGIDTTSGVGALSFNGKSYTAVLDGDTYKYTIPAADINSITEGGQKSATVTITDKAGNQTDYNISLNFYNEKATITATFAPGDIDVSGKKYFKWDDPNNKYAKVTYEIKSQVELNTDAVFTCNTDENVTLTSKGKGTDGNYQYTFEKSFNPLSDGALSDIKLKVTNIHNVETISTAYTKYVDVTNPSVDSGVGGDPTWHNSDIILNVNISDVAGSGVDGERTTAKGATITSKNDSTVVAIVDEATTNAGVRVYFTVYDKAGNVLLDYDAGVYKVDKERPAASLSIAGSTWETYPADSNESFLDEDPVITFSSNDSVSGIDSAVLYVNGTAYPSAVSGQKLSEIIGETLSETTFYTIEYKVKDVAGNENNDCRSKVKIDSSKPDLSKSSVTTASMKENDYFNKDVNVKLVAVDSNLVRAGLSVTDSYDGSEFDVDWKKSGNTWTGTITLSAEGRHDITFSAVDESINQSTWTKTVYIDKTAPEITSWMDDDEYDDMEAYYNKDTSAEITVRDTYEDPEDVTTEINIDIPGDGSNISTKQGKGPFVLKDDGYYTITYTVVDLAGNESQKTVGVTIDKTSPVHNLYVTTDNPAKADAFPNNYVNKVDVFDANREVYLYGQYYNNDVTVDLAFFDYNMDLKFVHVYDGNEELPVNWTRDGAYGRATITFTQEKYYNISIMSEDKAGNQTADYGVGKTLKFYIDKTGPSLTASVNGYYGTEKRYLNTNGTVSISVSDAYKDSDLKRNVKMTTPGGVTTVREESVSEGSEVYDQEADYEVYYTAVDRAGNKATSNTVSFRVDKTAPQLSISSVGATTTASSVTITFNVKESYYSDMKNVTIKIYKSNDGVPESLLKTIDFKPNSPNDSTSFTFEDDARYRIEFEAEDRCGNKTQTTYSFTKDGTAPLITLSGKELQTDSKVNNYFKSKNGIAMTVTVNEAFYSTNSVKLSGTRTDIDGNKTNLDFGTFNTDAKGKKLSEITKDFQEDGIYDIYISSTDLAGNKSEASIHFTIDKTAPEVGDISKYNKVKLNKFVFDIDLDTLVRDLTVCDTKVYIDGVEYDGVTDLEDGSHVIKIVAVDELGNKNDENKATATFVLDTKAPNIIISNVEEGDRLIEATEIVVSAELEEDKLVSVQLNGKDVSITDDSQAKITIDQKGDYTISASASDDAGNESTIERHFSFGKQSNNTIFILIAGLAVVLLLVIILLVVRRRRS